MTETNIEFDDGITPDTVANWLVDVQEYVAGQGPTDEAWTRVRGLQEITPPQVEKNLEDDGEIDGNPWGSQVATGISWTAEGKVKIPRATLQRDPGQEILRNAGRGVAEDGIVWVRFYKANGDAAGDMGRADVTFTEVGGKKTDLTTADLTFTGRGALYPITVDASGASVPVEG